MPYFYRHYEKYIAPLPWYQKAWWWCNIFFLFCLLAVASLACYVRDEFCKPVKFCLEPPDPAPGPPPTAEELIAKAKADLQKWAAARNKM